MKDADLLAAIADQHVGALRAVHERHAAWLRTGGVGISVDVRWKLGTDATRRVDFVSAGADFIEYRPPFGTIGPEDISDIATLNNV